jgi:hypothetical protein
MQGEMPPLGPFSFKERLELRIPLMADSDSTFIADSIPFDGGHPALVS